MITLNRKTPKEKYNLDLNIRYVKCMHHSGYLNDDFHMNKHDFYEINFCKSSDILFTLGKDTLYLTNGDILIIPPNTITILHPVKWFQIILIYIHYGSVTIILKY